MRRRITAAVIIFLCMAGLLTGVMKSVAYAEEETVNSSLSGEVSLLRQDRENYVMQVTVKNAGEDFCGTVQVVFRASYGIGNCAYNTEITLPAQGEKQYTIAVPERAVDITAGEGILNFLNEKGHPVQSIPIKNLMRGFSFGISVGILSDEYSGLTYLDGGGEYIYVQHDGYPVNLIQLDKNNLRAYLDGLYFLVIDRFNVSALSSEDIQALQQWVRDGGWLIIGTGEYAGQTLSGFDEDFLELNVLGISEPGEDNIAENNSRYGYYQSYMDAEVHFTQMAIAELDYALSKRDYYESSENLAVYTAIGKGAVGVYFCSLSDPQLQKLEDRTVRYMYEELMYQARSYNNYSSYSSMNSAGQRALAYMGNRDSGVDFSLLRLLIGAYVILVGPVLYLILRKCKRREWYWVGAPALGLLFILGVFLLGQNARVNEARVYAVTAQKADEDWKDTYFLAYHSGIKPWNLLMGDDYEIAGPGWNGYEGKYYSDALDYFYTVDYDSEGLRVGAKPQKNFESGFFYAGGHTESRGAITGGHIKEYSDLSGNIVGTVTNGTDCDLRYMAVWRGQDLMIFENVKAGETLDMQQAEQEGRCVYRSGNIEDIGDMLLYSGIAMPFYRATAPNDQRYDEEEMSALLIGLGIAKESSPDEEKYAVIAGLIEQCDRVTEGKCKETSYECLYGYAETEV